MLPSTINIAEEKIRQMESRMHRLSMNIRQIFNYEYSVLPDLRMIYCAFDCTNLLKCHRWRLYVIMKINII